MPHSDWSAVFVALIIFAIIFAIAQALEHRIVRLCRFLNGGLWNFFTAPLKWFYSCTFKNLFSWLQRLLNNTWYGRLDAALSKAGGTKTLLFGIGAVVFVVLRILYVPAAAMELLNNLLLSTAIGAPLTFVLEGFSFSLSTLIGAAFTRYLSLEAMRKSDNMHLIAKLIYGFVFLCAFGLLGSAMSGVFDALSAFFTDSMNRIFTLESFPNAPDYVNYILLALLLILLAIVCYIWLILAIMTLKEYISNICFGIVPITLAALVMMTLSALRLTQVWLVPFAFLLLMIYGEFHRHKLENLTEPQLTQRQQKRKKWNPFARKRKVPQPTIFDDEE